MSTAFESTIHRFSRRQFEQMVDAGVFGPEDRVELLDGEILDMAPQKRLNLDIAWDPTKAQANISKHGVSFADAASVLLDPLAISVFDPEHSHGEERWFTLGLSSQRQLLAVAHAYQSTASDRVSVRIISARDATRRERTAYEQKQQ